MKFAGYALDPQGFELRHGGERVAVEPQVLSLLLLLAANRERMVSKDEIIEEVWDGRIVSESAISARIKAARKAVGDDGTAQKVIRTIHGRGFRFVAVVEESVAAVVEADEAPAATPPSTRPSIAVLPFALIGESGPHDIIADALPADIIMDLARINWLFVIARGSSFRFRGPDADPIAVGRALAVTYCLTGQIERTGHSVSVRCALIDTRDGHTVWSERYEGAIESLQELRPEIERGVVESVLQHIPQNEVRLARGLPAAQLDAWASFHLGIDHMYRFNAADNAAASRLFGHALERDPWFSRAMAGLSFTHFQSAFMAYDEQVGRHVEQARMLAQKAVETDRLDPFGHFSLGRCSWLEGRLDDSIAWFDRATSLSPSFAQGVYNRGLVATIAGQARQADRDLALALDLSPLDPMAYAMISGRALTHLQFGELEQAAQFGERAALTPGAHKHIKLIAALTLNLIGKRQEAAAWLAKARADDADLSAASFFRSFPYAQGEARETLERGLRAIGV
ncbi:winged helix-turn-helix domain-containing protein [Qipengyuania sp. 6B39]|uniref:winged helix-turn-helix domain-containing protein n=1 Tax=Qipengyuania proteolytica TaxID=2867239 RepID=UPI001C893A12|nr:winged helix-turn-helix domain-containing protein [Qipengyuania proteolytica]